MLNIDSPIRIKINRVLRFALITLLMNFSCKMARIFLNISIANRTAYYRLDFSIHNEAIMGLPH